MPQVTRRPLPTRPCRSVHAAGHAKATAHAPLQECPCSTHRLRAYTCRCSTLHLHGGGSNGARAVCQEKRSRQAVRRGPLRALSEPLGAMFALLGNFPCISAHKGPRCTSSPAPPRENLAAARGESRCISAHKGPRCTPPPAVRFRSDSFGVRWVVWGLVPDDWPRQHAVAPPGDIFFFSLFPFGTPGSGGTATLSHTPKLVPDSPLHLHGGGSNWARAVCQEKRSRQAVRRGPLRALSEPLGAMFALLGNFPCISAHKGPRCTSSPAPPRENLAAARGESRCISAHKGPRCTPPPAVRFRSDSFGVRWVVWGLVPDDWPRQHEVRWTPSTATRPAAEPG